MHTNPGYTPVRTRIMRNPQSQWEVFYRSTPHESWSKGATCASYTIAVLVAGTLGDALNCIRSLE